MLLSSAKTFVGPGNASPATAKGWDDLIRGTGSAKETSEKDKGKQTMIEKKETFK